MWDAILNPFVTLMTLFYSVLGQNIVLAIVVLTVVIRLLVYPLTAQQQRSTKKQAELQPRLNKLKEKYKDDREALSRAQMDLYKEAGINPLGGCLPLLIQFPILIGMYQAIFFALASTPYEIVDLSDRLLLPGLDSLIPLQNMWLGMDLTAPPTPPGNPIYALALPLLVMATTWLQSKLTMARSAANPAAGSADAGGGAAAMTQSMVTIMPLMLGFFALTFSAGLSIYFVTSNAIGIFQYSEYGERFWDRISGFFSRSAKDEVAVVQADTGQAKQKAVPASKTKKNK
jgi:YidC/Oxa1 family membrane protein insertase